MTNGTTHDTTLRDLYRALFRHRGKALLFFLVVMAATVAATVLTPRAYLSESKLFVRLGRENATLDPTVTLGNDPVVVVPAAREDEMNSVAAILASRTMLERVVDMVGPNIVLHVAPEAGPARVALRQAGTGAMLDASGEQVGGLVAQATTSIRRALFHDDLPLREKALRHISQNLQVAPVRKSNIVVVAYEAPTPELSQRVVASLVDAYLEEHARLNRVPGSHRFFAEQAKRLANELLELEEEFAELKTTTGLASIDDQRIQIITRLGRLEDDLLAADTVRAESEAKVVALQTMLQELPKEHVAQVTEGVNDTGTDGIRQQFFALQLQEKQAAAIYTDSHPRLQAIREELALAQKIHDAEEHTRPQITTAPDNIYEQTRQALSVEQPILESLTAKTKALKRQLASVRNELDILNVNETRIANLQREIELREADYRKYSVNLEQARIDDALESQRMSNISLVQPASYEVRPIRPRVLMNLALGLLVSLFGAFGLALFAEYADHSFRTPEDIERNLELPTLAVIPRGHRRAVKTHGRN